MKRLRWIIALFAVALAGTGCVVDGGDDGGVVVLPLEADILSDTRVSGDIDADGVITVGAGTVLAGVSPTTGNEFRGFFLFPLTSVPADASIRSATLEVFVIDLAPLTKTPFTLDLVSFAPPLVSADFSRTELPPIRSRTFDMLPGDPGSIVRIDVTTMVQEAFRRRLADCQFRLLLDLTLNVGLVTLANPASSAATAPILHIEYF